MNLSEKTRDIYSKRIDCLRDAMYSAGLELLAINAGPDLSYFTGLQFHISERPVILLISQSKEPLIFFPEFESEKVQSSVLPLVSFPYDEVRLKWAACLSAAFKSLVLKDNKVGVNPISIRFLEVQLLQEAAPEMQIVSAVNILSQLRQKKDQTEVENITTAILIAQQALEKTLPFISIAKTEKEIANELVIQLLKAGSDPELPFSPIVATGENSANPHALPTERKIKSGDLLLFDWGARFNGYVSDLTRTFAIGEISQEFKSIYEIVREANQRARESLLESTTCHQIDQTARNVIEKAGWGKFFTHRTGHGIGLEAHEEPYIQSGNQTKLENGMVFTIEPGIYLP